MSFSRRIFVYSRRFFSDVPGAPIVAFTLENVTKRFPTGRVLFDNVNLSFFHGAKIGVIGLNGAGKSSLLRIIAGVDKEFDGEFRLKPNFRVGYLAQEPKLDEEKNVFDNIMDGLSHKTALVKEYEEICLKFNEPDVDMDKLLERQSELQAKIDLLGCWDLSHRVDQAMDALRCPPADSPVNNLSGGERRRVALCRLLLSEPDILLLDEPTNHLDAESVSWIERFLQTYRGLVIAITHDRYFLDNLASYILEIDSGRLIPFKGNYESWLESKQARLALEKKQQKNLEKILQKELTWLRQSNRAQQGKSKARVKSVQSLQEEKERKSMSKKIESGALIIPEGPRLGTKVLEMENITCVVEGRVLFEKFNFTLNKGVRLGIIGPNGSGKTSLIRLVTGESSPATGKITIGPTVVIGYNAQSRDALNDEKMVYEEICGNEEYISVAPGEQMLARAYVAQFNFSGTQQQKRIAQLSGGERNRVSLAKSLAKGCNLIILDEPTNDLDVQTLRALEEALLDFDGSAMVVSHDRWFLDRIANELLIFQEDGTVKHFQGNYTDWEQEKIRQFGKDWAPKRKKFVTIR